MLTRSDVKGDDSLVKIGIIGGTGYTGVELMRLLGPRSDASISVITSRELCGTPVDTLFPNLRGIIDLKFSEPDNPALDECDVVFFATPHSVAMQRVPKLLKAGVRVIDLSADFRLKDADLWQRWYGMRHECPELLAEAVYGLPEINRDAVINARLVAVPGCYPTAVQLGLLPLLENKVIAEDRLIADVKSGVSGAGRKASVDGLLAEVAESVKAYGVEGHRHFPEICQELNRVSANSVGLVFVPHLVPMIRGILATLYAPLRAGVESDILELHGMFERRYRKESFIEVLPLGTLPETRDVRGSNRCEISISYSEQSRTAIIIVVEDNLVKGASGQAIQNFNLMFGLGETTGLMLPALLP